MPQIMGAVVGFLYSIMNVFNAQLSLVYGNPYATVIIHVVGLACVLPLTLRTLFQKKRAPLWMHIGGVLGIFTVVTSNLGVNALGVTVTLSLTLLGQLICSMVFDQFGLWGFEKRKFKPAKAFSLVLIAAGVGVMLLW